MSAHQRTGWARTRGQKVTITKNTAITSPKLRSDEGFISSCRLKSSCVITAALLMVTVTARLPLASRLEGVLLQTNFWPAKATPMHALHLRRPMVTGPVYQCHRRHALVLGSSTDPK